jgi:hypothetical protein
MIFFSAFMMWSFSPAEYNVPGSKPTSIFRPLWDSINFTDFIVEILGSLKFFVDYARGKPGAHAPRTQPGPDGRKVDFGEAFGVEGAARTPDGENVRLQPYPPAPAGQSDTPPSSSEFARTQPAQRRLPP